MQNPDDPFHTNAKLQISFPKSSEDHRLQLVGINGAIMAIVHSPLESAGPINFYCEDWSLIILAPIRSKSDIVISAINIVCLNEINSTEGIISIQASNRLVTFTPSIKPSTKTAAIGASGEYYLGDDPAAFLYYFQLFNKIVSGAHDKSSDSFIAAQQNFIISLCALAKKMEGNVDNLTIHKVLEIWDIPHKLETLEP